MGRVEHWKGEGQSAEFVEVADDSRVDSIQNLLLVSVAPEAPKGGGGGSRGGGGLALDDLA